jgi:predicted  nucleic acid-binding Zn-ribbon protein
VRTRQIAQTSLAPNFNRLAISLACATLVSAAVIAAQPAHGQSASDAQVSSLETEVRYDDQTLRAFAAAAASVLALRNRYYPRIRAAEIAEAKERADILYKEMLEQMHVAISGSGFSEEQYRVISSAAKADAQLRGRINTILKGPSPAQQHVQNVARLTAKAPEIATAPTDAAPVQETVAPATPPATPEPSTTTAPPVDTGARQRLETELGKVNAERDRFQVEQTALQEKVKKLEQQLSAVKAQDSALRQQLTEEKENALAQQKKTERELKARGGEVATLKEELANVQSRDSSLREQLEVERARADAAQTSKEAKLAAFRQEIKQFAGRLATAQQELNSLAIELTPGDTAGNDNRMPAFEALTPLRSEPTSIERVLAKVQPQYAAQQELNNQIAQIEDERVRRQAERVALQQEIAELSRNLAATYQAMAELIGEPANTVVAAAELDTDYETYALDFSQETAELFQTDAARFDQAFADPQAGLQREEPDTLGVGDTVIEQSAAGPAQSATLEPADVAPLRINSAPTVQIATAPAAGATGPANPADSGTGELDGLAAVATGRAPADGQPPHQIVRDDQAFKPAVQTIPQTEIAVAEQAPIYKKTVRGGADAYRATDYQRAYDIWAALAESGNRSAQFHLGALYFEGRGTDVDFSQSFFWLRVSAYQGDQRASSLLKTVGENLTRDQIDASDHQAREWLQERSIEVTQFEADGKNRL